MSKYISGKNSVLEALKYEVPLKKLYLAKNVKLQNIHVKYEIKSNHELDEMVHANHQGYVAELQDFEYFNVETILEDKPEKVLVLDHIQDPGNFGAIIRTANAAGIKHIIIPKDRAVAITPVVLKIASGGQIGMKIVRVDSLYPSLKYLQDNGFWIYATALDETAVDSNYATYNYPMALIVGNEQKGVNKTLLKMADEKVYINMNGTVQSLNVSVATGIMLFKI